MKPRRTTSWLAVVLLSVGCAGTAPQHSAESLDSKATEPAPAAATGAVPEDNTGEAAAPRAASSPAAAVRPSLPDVDPEADAGPIRLSLPDVGPEADASAVHESALVVDLHMDTLWQLHTKGGSFRDNSPKQQLDLHRMEQGGLDAQVFAIWMPPSSPEPQSLVGELVSLFEREILDATPELELARTADDVLRIRVEGKRAAILGLEGAVALDGDVDFMRALHARGVRYAALTWNESNPFGDGAKGNKHGGATELGLALVKLLNELRVIVDVSHAAPTTFWDVITASERPVIASHSNAAAICDHARNLDDVQLWAIAESGGVVGLNFHSRFLTCRRGAASMKHVLAHATHLREVIGAEHMALGSDFDGNIVPPKKLADAAALPRLTRALTDHAFTNAETVDVLGHAFLRTFHETSVGQAERRAPFRPIKVKRVQASSAARTAKNVVDHHTTTSWQPNRRDDTPWLRLHTQGRGLSRLSLSGGNDSDTGEPLVVRITVMSADVEEPYVTEVTVESVRRPTRLLLPEHFGCVRTATIEIAPTETTEAGARWALTEVVPERDVGTECDRR